MQRFGRELAVAGALAALLLVVLVRAPGFYEARNVMNLLVDNGPVLVAAVGMTLVILAAQIDISVASLYVVCGVAAGLLAKAGLPMAAVVGLTLLVGGALGALNGALVAGAKISSIIVTLATLVILREGIRWLTGGVWIEGLPATFQWFGLGQVGGEWLLIGVAAAVFVVAVLALNYTAAGRSIYATGCDPEAARLAGVEPGRVVFGVFVLMGVLMAITALLSFTRFPTIETNAGLGMELKVIACVVVGGTAITGGRGSLWGTLLGVALLGTIGTVLTFLHADPAWERAVQGAVILLSVVADTARRRAPVRREALSVGGSAR